MPSKNSLKIYLENGYYHIYNRGTDRKEIFKDQQDYAVFLSYLKECLLSKDINSLQAQLSDPNTHYREKDRIIRKLGLANFSKRIVLISYCLMPNHLHFLIKQLTKDAIYKFMLSLSIRYGMYFNRKYKRVGQIFQDVYKAVLVESDEQLLYLSGYIHRNPLPKVDTAFDSQNLALLFAQPSSYPEFLEQKKTGWIHPEEILACFPVNSSKLSYQSFVEQTDEASLIQPIEKLIIDF